MIKSMTAFARLKGSAKEGGWEVEIRSINHRYFEFSVRTPPGLSGLEAKIRELVQSQIARGKITVVLGQEASADAMDPVQLNETAVEFYMSSIQKLVKKYKLNNSFSASDLIRMPGVFSEAPRKTDPEKEWPSIKKVLIRALEQTRKSKQLEGGKLAADIAGRLQKIEAAVRKIESLAGGESQRAFKRIQERVENLFQDKEKDLDRYYREAAFLAERCDVTEEVVRLRSHLDLFKRRLHEDHEVGRELDFVCQEMNREANTMASKSQLFEISTEVVQVKGEIEKIREQIQNIE